MTRKVYLIFTHAILIALTLYAIIYHIFYDKSTYHREVLIFLTTALVFGALSLSFQIGTYKILRLIKPSYHLTTLNSEDVFTTKKIFWVFNIIYGLFKLVFGCIVFYALMRNPYPLLSPYSLFRYSIDFILITSGTISLIDAWIMRKVIKSLKNRASEDFYAEFGKKTETNDRE